VVPPAPPVPGPPGAAKPLLSSSQEVIVPATTALANPTATINLTICCFTTRP
jgi:hypothetical protein